MKFSFRSAIVIGIIVILGATGYAVWVSHRDNVPEGFAVGNGRLEATEIDIATKLAGRVEKILVNEGDFVQEGQELAVMQTDVLQAQFYEARAQYYEAVAAAARAKANIRLRESDKVAAIATVAQRQSVLDANLRRLARSSTLTGSGAVSRQRFDDDETSAAGARAAVEAARAEVTVADAAIEAAKADAQGADAKIKAMEATVTRIQADIKDSTLVAPTGGRVQYRIAQPGEVLGAGGKVLNMVDLTDVYMTIFLPTAQAGLLSLGSEARILADAAPDYPIPAVVSFVSNTAQFTPKAVDTPLEREKLMFRVKVRVDRDLLEKYQIYVKTGLPGVAWVKTSPNAVWPESLKARAE